MDEIMQGIVIILRCEQLFAFDAEYLRDTKDLVRYPGEQAQQPV